MTVTEPEPITFPSAGGRTAHALLRETAAVMRRALAVGGTSFDALYVNVDGRSGYFARSLNAYGKEGEPCPRCATTLEAVFFEAAAFVVAAFFAGAFFAAVLRVAFLAEVVLAMVL